MIEIAQGDYSTGAVKLEADGGHLAVGPDGRLRGDVGLSPKSAAALVALGGAGAIPAALGPQLAERLQSPTAKALLPELPGWRGDVRSYRHRPRAAHLLKPAPIAPRAAISMVRRPEFLGTKVDQKTPSLDQVRARIDAIDAELLRLVDERAGIARVVADAKRAAGDGDKFGLRPTREAQLLRKLLATPRQGASDALTVRLWRELIADSLATQGPFHLSVWGASDPAHTVEQARFRFGGAPPLAQAARPEDALAAAKTRGGVGVLALTADSGWWGRLLAEPSLSVFDSLPCLSVWGPRAALAVAQIEVEPTGADETFWVTDAAQPAATICEALSRDGVAGCKIASGGGLKLFSLAGFYQKNDERLARAPGRLTGVIGASALPFDV